MMNIGLSPRRVVGVLGWFAAWGFWLAIIGLIVGLMTAQADSGAGMVLVFGGFFVGATFPLLIIPVGILVYGVRKDHELPLPRTLFKWGTISAVVYLASLAIAFMFMQ